ncbi:MAG: TetR/AcrR family transcriptional regulator [Balneolaceae bacterium]|nr:TetR/AcrR family transcriptional regulator [Balneolaceae bacterium]
MEEIAQKAELSKGTLYLYFKNKQDLYIAICKRGSNMLNKRFSKIITADHTGIELIRLMGEAYLDFVHNHPDYYNAFMYYETLKNTEELENSEMAQTCEENRREAMTYMIRALQIGMQDGTIDDSYDPRELAIVLWSCTRGITTMDHMRQTGHHFKMLDEMDIETDSLFGNFLNLVGKGMATEKAKNNKMTNGHFNET